MSIKALDKNINVLDVVKSWGEGVNNLLAGTLSPETKLQKIMEKLQKDTQEKKVLARQIGAQMRALYDPNTAALEPLEAFKVRRQKLVNLGGQNLSNAAKLGQIQQEIKALDTQIVSTQGTYDTLKESYDVAMSNYRQTLASLEYVQSNGPAMLNAIRATQQALELKNKTSKQAVTSVSFMDELTKELGQTQAELRSEKAIDADLDATNATSLNDELAKMDAQTVDAGLMAEFQAAAAK